ncbi:MAG TPA: DUF2635 domain-containing protein [Methylomirabilota bacterium]|nr:DUF2635 domain-containing protein [Methylomirabilota bacterium]
MAEKMFVIPRQGLVVRDPVTRQPLPAEGGHVPRDAYWLRRLADGDLAMPATVSKSKPGNKAGSAKE